MRAGVGVEAGEAAPDVVEGEQRVAEGRADVARVGGVGEVALQP